MHGSAPWKTEETIVGLPRLLVLSVFQIWWLSPFTSPDSPDLVAVTFGGGASATILFGRFDFLFRMSTTSALTSSDGIVRELSTQKPARWRPPWPVAVQEWLHKTVWHWRRRVSRAFHRSDPTRCISASE